MSRRWKYLIAALFVVLLGVPVIYMARTWHPENPLRFELVEEARGLEFDPPGSVGLDIIYLRVTNASATPIYVEGCLLHRDSVSPAGREMLCSADVLMPENADPMATIYARDVRVPPHGVAFAMGWVQSKRMPWLRKLGKTEVTVHYTWSPHARCYFQRAAAKLRKHAPDALRDYVPDLEMYRDQVSLEPYANNGSSSGATGASTAPAP